jgi:hypothetical protein
MLTLMLSLKLIGRTITLVGTVLLMASVAACRHQPTMEPKTRPSGIPDNAVWVGGADGGAYVYCTIDEIRNVNPCKVWNDYTGNLVESGDYRLAKENRAAKKTELRVSFPDFGGNIYLEGGLVLKRQ